MGMTNSGIVRSEIKIEKYEAENEFKEEPIELRKSSFAKSIYCRVPICVNLSLPALKIVQRSHCVILTILSLSTSLSLTLLILEIVQRSNSMIDTHSLCFSRKLCLYSHSLLFFWFTIFLSYPHSIREYS